MDQCAWDYAGIKFIGGTPINPVETLLSG